MCGSGGGRDVWECREWRGITVSYKLNNFSRSTEEIFYSELCVCTNSSAVTADFTP